MIYIQCLLFLIDITNTQAKTIEMNVSELCVVVNHEYYLLFGSNIVRLLLFDCTTYHPVTYSHMESYIHSKRQYQINKKSRVYHDEDKKETVSGRCSRRLFECYNL